MLYKIFNKVGGNIPDDYDVIDVASKKHNVLGNGVIIPDVLGFPWPSSHTRGQNLFPSQSLGFEENNLHRNLCIRQNSVILRMKVACLVLERGSAERE